MKVDIFKSAILNLGVHNDLSFKDQFNIRMLNFICLAIIFWVLAVMYLLPFDVTLYDLGFIFIPLAGLYANYRQRYLIAKVLVFVIIPLMQFGNCFQEDMELNGRMFVIFPLACFALVSYSKQWIGILNSALIYVLIVWGSYLDSISLGSHIAYNIYFVSICILAGVVLFVQNVGQWSAELKSRNKQLNAQNQKLSKLVQQNEAKTQLLAILSHDLKAPVSAFDKLADKVAYLMKRGDYAQLYQLADYYETSGKNLFTNIERLLNWAMSQKQSIQTVRTNFRIYDLFQEVYCSLHYWIKEKNLSIDYINEEALKGISIYTDQEILFIILKNLVENAVKYSPVDSVIQLRYELANESHIIEVLNHGASIPLDVIKNIDQGKFNRSSDSFGLGLSICHNLIKTLDGQLVIESIDADSNKATVSFDKIVDKAASQATFIEDAINTNV